MKSKLITLLLAILLGANIVLARDYVVFVSQQDGSSVGLIKLSTHQILEYSEDTITWTNMTTETTIPLDDGDSIFVRGILSEDVINQDLPDFTKFSITGHINSKGNINTLWDYTAPCFERNFIMRRGCGYCMFENCSGLYDVSELEFPSANLSYNCYQAMFKGCTNLILAPILPAHTLVNYCYSNMFYGCSNLSKIICYASNVSAYKCTSNWVNGVASSGIFVKANSMDDWSEGDSGIPSGWTVDTQCLISSGTCGTKLIWELSCDSVLTISGTGAMADSPTWRADSLAIKEVIIHEGVTSIGNSAFHRCRNLISVTIPNSVVSIGSGAFSRSGVVSMTIPSGVTTIDRLAFNNCNSLEVISISNTVTEIREQAFHRCQNLSNIHVDLDNLNYSSVDGILFNKNQTKLIKYPDAKQGEYTIPNSVTEIDIFAFAMCIDLTAVHIPETIDTIRCQAFFECTSLASMRCDAITPPVLDYSVFFHVDCPNIPLYVPVASIDLYKAADQWKEFKILPIEKKYQISWVNFDESVLKIDSIWEDSIPSFSGETPTKPATKKYTYTFNGWSPDIVAVTGDVTYIAQFDSTLIEYEIHVTPEGGTTEGGTVTIDGNPNYGETVTLTPVPDEGYEFDHWSDGNTNNPRDIVVGGDSTIYPIFVKKQYLIQFVNYDESVLQSGNVEHGVKPQYNGETPTKPANPKYTYTFKGWNAEIVVATEPATYTAQFDSTLIEYEIHVTPEGGSTEGGTVTIDGDTNYGDTVTLTPVPDEGYVFEQWSDGNTDNPRDIVVGGDSTIYPIFHKCEEIITLTEIVIGKGESYEFGGKTYTTRGIYYDTIVLANGCDSISTLKLSVVKKKTFNLRAVVDSTQMAYGTAIGSGIYNDGQTVTIEAIPASSKYVFARWWNPDEGIEIFENPYTFTLTRNLTVKAVFKRARKRIVVKQQGASYAMSHPETDIVAVIEVGERTAMVNNTSESTYRIYDSAGHLIIISAEDNTYALPTGLYFIQIDGQTEKFIIH